MRFSRKPKVEEGLESDGQKWVLAMISIRSPLKPIHTLKNDKESSGDDEESYSTTPTREEAKIKTLLSCPPAPRKPKPTLKYNNGRTRAREFFTPPDLETAFICHVERERAN